VAIYNVDCFAALAMTQALLMMTKEALAMALLFMTVCYV